MALLPILTAPDPRLKKKSKPVESVDEGVRRLMDDMLETMYAAPGIGLAAPQVGELRRVIVLDIDREDVKTGPLFMANPEIVEASDEDVSYEEGCLSVPDHYSDVVRPAKVTVRYLDRDGKQQDMTIEQARALIADGTISGGMIPKVENCIDAVNSGVEAAVIMDGRVPHALLLEVFTEAGIGTMVKRA